MTFQINIGGSSNDPFYRYKMPPVSVVNKSGKTEITNLSAIAHELERPENFLRATFKVVFNTTVTEKHRKTVLARTITQKQLQDCLSTIVKKYVLCPVCENPETIITKEGTMSCRSCGHDAKLDLPSSLKKCL